MVPPPHRPDKLPILMSCSQFLILRPEFHPFDLPQGQVPLKTRSTGPTEAGTGGAPGTDDPTAEQTSGPCGDSLWMILAMFAVLYLVMIRPQQKQEKARKALLAAVVKGDKVVTNSGLHGTITNLSEDKVTLRVDKDMKLTFDRSAIGRKLSDETEADKS